MALEPLVPRGRAETDESVGSFVRRRFGREVLERVADPLVSGLLDDRTGAGERGRYGPAGHRRRGQRRRQAGWPVHVVTPLATTVDRIAMVPDGAREPVVAA
jgi:hypothetical protein